MLNGCRYCDTPIALRPFDDFREILVEQKVVQRRIAPVRFDDPVQKFRPNDAAAPPDGSDVAEVKVPIICGAPRAQKLHALCIRNDF